MFVCDGKKGIREKKKKRKEKKEKDKGIHTRRCVYDLFTHLEKNFEKKAREKRDRMEEGGKGKGKGKGEGGEGREEKNCTPDDGETSYNYGYCVLRFYSRLFLSSVELVGTASVSWLVVDLVLVLLDSWTLPRCFFSVDAPLGQAGIYSLSLSLTDQTVRSEKLKRKKKKWREPAISENS